MLNDLDAMIAAAKKRIHKMVDLRGELFKGERKASTCRRAVGQWHKVRKPKETT